MHYIFFRQLQLITVLLLIRDSYTPLRTTDKVRLSENVSGIFHFWFSFAFLKVYIFVVIIKDYIFVQHTHFLPDL